MAEFKRYASKEKEAVIKQLDQESSFLMKILRGHFLIEQKLNDILFTLVRNPEILKTSNSPRIDFHTKTFIIRSLIPKISHADWLWPSIGKLNTIRNKMAHGLESEKLDNGIAEFIKYQKDNDSTFKGKLKELNVLNKEDQCIAVISAIYAFLTVYLQKIEESQKNV